MTASAPATTEQALNALATGEISMVGQMPWSSNATFLVDVDALDFTVQAVYKPVRGERRLWDFPSGLHKRERACFLLSEALGWNLVPPTVIRDGPLGEGSLQLFVLADFSQHYFTLRDIDTLHLPLRRLCAFDFVSNATDRKSGHVLLHLDSQNIFAIDNGLSFHSDFKLRTVLWDYSGEPLPQCVMSDLTAFLARPAPDELVDVLAPAEVDAALERAELLLESGTFPTDPSGQRWPWPVV